MKQQEGAEKIENDMVSPGNNVYECHFVRVEERKNLKGRIRAPLRNTILHTRSDTGEKERAFAICVEIREAMELFQNPVGMIRPSVGFSSTH